MTRLRNTMFKGRSLRVEGRMVIRPRNSFPLITTHHRLNYDAATSRVERVKNSKKDKDKEEADVELDICKSK